MAKYIFRTEETHYLTYELDVPESVTDIDQYFYDNSEIADLIDRECFEFELVEVTKVDTLEKVSDHV